MFKKISSLVLSLFFVGVFLSACGVKGPEALVPEDAAVTVVIPKLADTGSSINEFVDWLAKNSEQMAQIKAQAAAFGGGDIAGPETFKKMGIDSGKGAVYAVLNPQAGEWLAAIPVADEDAFMNNVKIYLFSGQEPQKNGDVYNTPFGVMTIKKSYAVMANNKATLDKAGSGKSVAKTDGYKKAVDELGESNDLFVYFSSKSMKNMGIPGGPQEKQMETIIGSFPGVGLTVNLESGKVVSRYYAPITNGKDAEDFGKLMAASDKGPRLDAFPGPAVMLARFNISMPAMLELMERSQKEDDGEGPPPPDIKAMLGMVPVFAGLDTDKDIIGNIEGNPALALYSPKRRSGDPLMVIAIEVKDGKKAQATLEKIQENMLAGKKKRKGKLDDFGVIEYKMGRDTTYAAVRKNIILISNDDDVMKSAVLIADGTPEGDNALKGVTDSYAKSALKDKNTSVFYMGLKELKESSGRSDFGQYIGMIPGVDEGFLLFTSSPEKDGVKGEIVLNLGKGK